MRGRQTKIQKVNETKKEIHESHAEREHDNVTRRDIGKQRRERERP